jgi:uncharacterized protein (TIGR00369 family)
MELNNQSLDVYRAWMCQLPHQRAIGFELIELIPEYAIGRIPYRPEFVGNPLTGVVHGGIVTTLLDAVGGAAVIGRCGKLMTMATLDLRIDYLRPSKPQHDLFARVECYKLTRNIAFARGVAYDDALDNPLASMSATYMLNTPTQRHSSTRREPNDRLA